MRLLHDEFLTDVDVAAEDGQEAVRKRAIQQLQRRRRFRIEAIASAIGMAILVAIWAMSEYHSAGGWPTNGFSQSSGIHDVWNYWIVYPVGAWVLILATRAWMVFGGKPITESEIEKEIEHQHGRR